MAKSELCVFWKSVASTMLENGLSYDVVLQFVKDNKDENGYIKISKIPVFGGF